MAFCGVTRYAEPSDISAHALPSGALSNPGRPVAPNASLDLFALDMHGAATGDPVEFRAEGSSGALPAPIVEGTTYYVIALSQSRFSVSATSGGAAIDLTTSGENVLATFPAPVEAALDKASRLIDEMIPAHVVPFADDAIPEIVRMTCAEIAGGILLDRGGTPSKSLSKIVERAHKLLEHWFANHKPVRNAGVPASLSVSVPACSVDGGWRRHGGL